MDLLYQAKCEVCNLSAPRININCPHCAKIIRYEGDATTRCKHCKKRILIEDIENILVDQAALHIKAMEGDLSNPEASCVECDGFHTVINTKHNQLLCMACLSDFQAIYLCDWCGEGNTKILDNSYYEGCSHCNGASDWRRDD
jgi:predicted amidophosphoribosyltransferase